MTARLLRLAALIVAVAGVVDPAVPVERAARPVISVTAAPADEALAATVATHLRPALAVVRGPVAGAAARVVVGETAPLPGPADVPGFAVVPDPGRPRATIVELRVPTRAPLRARVPVGARIRARTSAAGVGPGGTDDTSGSLEAGSTDGASGGGEAGGSDPSGAPETGGTDDASGGGVAGGATEEGQPLEVELRVDGLVADREVASLSGAGPDAGTGDDELFHHADLSFIPARTGAHRLRVTARLAGVETSADALVSVDDEPWRVLFHDPRPSWTSTFVRRALEEDGLFQVSTRVATSPRSMVTSGEPPTAPLDAAELRAFDVVVVGAPDVLAAGDVAALEAFLRRRGGSVVLLVDGPPGAAATLTGTRGWEERLRQEPVPLRPAGGADASPAVADPGGADASPAVAGPGGADASAAVAGPGRPDTSSATDRPGRPDAGGSPGGGTAGDGVPLLLASEIAVPGSVPAGARPLAVAGAAEDAAVVVWELPVGAGRIVVSGALDAWRFRGPADSGFDPFWRGVVADAAAAAPPPVAVTIMPSVARPGEQVEVEVTLRDLALAGAGAGADGAAAAGVRVIARLEGGDGPLAVPLWPGVAGRLHGGLRLPEAPGLRELVVTTGDGATAAAPLLVVDDALDVARVAPGALAAWASAHGGEVVPASRLDDLPAALGAALGETREPATWRPLRSAWWIVPFALALGGEWWIRRRRGER